MKYVQKEKLVTLSTIRLPFSSPWTLVTVLVTGTGRGVHHCMLSLRLSALMLQHCCMLGKLCPDFPLMIWTYLSIRRFQGATWSFLSSSHVWVWYIVAGLLSRLTSLQWKLFLAKNNYSHFSKLNFSDQTRADKCVGGIISCFCQLSDGSNNSNKMLLPRKDGIREPKGDFDKKSVQFSTRIHFWQNTKNPPWNIFEKLTINTGNGRRTRGLCMDISMYRYRKQNLRNSLRQIWRKIWGYFTQYSTKSDNIQQNLTISGNIWQ